MTAPRAGRAAVALLLAALGCATPQAPDGGARSPYDRALSQLATDRAAGIEALEAYVEANPRAALADDAGLRLAELALEDGDEVEAERRLRTVIERQPTGDRTDEARLLLAQQLLRQDRVGESYRTAAAIRLSLLPQAERREAHRFLADLASARGEVAARLRWLGRVREDQPDAEAARAIDREIDAIVERMDDHTLEVTAAQLGKRVPAARLRLRQAELAVLEGRIDDATSLLAEAERLPLTPPDVPRAQELAARVAGGGITGSLLGELPGSGEDAALIFDPTGSSGTLGAVLPLTGPYAAFGEESLQGIALALGLFGQDGPRPSGLRLVVRDSAGDPDRAAAAVAELATDPELLAIVGPLLGGTAASAGPVAEAHGVPLLTLTRRDGVAETGRSVLRLGGSPQVEAELLADYATNTLGGKRFALLYPDDSYGRALRGRFWEAVEARGGEVVGVARYEVGATDFAGPIRDLLGFTLLSRAEKTALADRSKMLKRAKRLPPEAAAELRQEAWEMTGPDEEPLPPFLDFDTLFVPDTYEAVALIAPHLAFHDVRGVRLLGPSGWNAPELVEIGGRHLNGAVFTAAFFAESQRPQVVDFTGRYQGAYARVPTYVAAQAFDAANLALVQIQLGRTDRARLLEGLLGSAGFPGVTGPTTLDAEGVARRRPLLLGVDRGQIVSIDERGEPPELPPAPVRPWELEPEGEGEFGGPGPRP